MSGRFTKSLVLSLIALFTITGCSVSVGVKEEQLYGTTWSDSMITIFTSDDVAQYIKDKRLAEPSNIILSNSEGEDVVVDNAVYYGEHEYPSDNGGSYKIRYAINESVFGGEVSLDATGCKETLVSSDVVSKMDACGVSLYHIRNERVKSTKRAYISFN